MIIAISIIVALLVGWLLASSCFDDHSDMFRGVDGFIGFWGQRYRNRKDKMLEAWQDDDHWIPGSVRFMFVLVMAGVAGYWTYRGLHALFG